MRTFLALALALVLAGPAVATDIDLRQGSPTALGFLGKPISIQTMTVNYADNPTTVGQNVHLFHIPKNTLVLGVLTEVVVPAGATCTIDIGDDGSATRYFSNFDMTATAGTASWSYTTNTLDLARFYTAADLITVNSDHITTGGTLRATMLAIQP